MWWALNWIQIKMLPSGSDFFACGHKVHMPNIQAGSKSQRTHKTVSFKEENNGSNNQRRSSRAAKSHPATNVASQFSVQQHVDELSKTLEFSYDVVSTRSPHMISYSHGKGRNRSLFKANSLGINTTHDRTPKTNGVVVRHNCRGEPKRHMLCNLSMDHTTPPSSTHTWKAMPIPNSRGHTCSTLPGLTSSNELVSTESKVKRTSVVPLSKSFPWEEETLHKVNSSTARRLVGLPSTISVTQNASHDLQQLSPRHSNIRDGRESEYKMEWTERSSSPPLRSYVSQIRTGAKPVHQARGEPESIILSNDAHFNKVLQTSYPQSPRFDGDECVPSSREGAMTKGYRKWLDYPQPVKTPDSMQWECQSVVSLGSSEQTELNKEQSTVPLSQHPIQNQQFFSIMHEWCNKWQLHLQLKDVKDQRGILNDMHSLCDNTKMFAITSVALLAKNEAISHTKSQSGVVLIEKSREAMTDCPVVVGGVSSSLVEGLCQLLSSQVEHIKVPSALTLYCLDKQNQRTEDVLLSVVSNGVGLLERWVSAQCLACAGVCSATVISELIAHLQDGGHQPERKNKAADLLASLSTKTNLVHVLLAEQLNSSGWQERLAVCQMLHRLYGGINKDLCSKLVVLTWDDWSPEVRQAAAQALGLTGHGKLIHDEIGKRLASKMEIICLDALKKLHTLHFMTDQLLPAFLSCFKDNHISIRIEATTIAGALKLTHPHVLQALYKLLQDPCWKVKAHALRAFADIGVSSEDLVTQLLWAVRFEKLPAIQAEACHTIAKLGLNEEKVIHTLRELLMVEDEELVLREVSLTLQTLGCSSEAKDDMLDTIRSEVQRLGTLEAITRDVLGSERSTMTQYVSERPRKLLTTRDYLNDKHRNSHYSNHRAQRETIAHSPKQSSTTIQKHSSENITLTDKLAQDDGTQSKSWTPDRKTIDTQLNRMRRRVSVDVSG